MRRRGIEAYPYLQPDTFVDSTTAGLTLSDGATVIPLSGIPNTLTILCNESGTTIGYRSDSLGFRNPQNVWTPLHIDAALIGDSFVHGFCRSESETIGGVLRSRGIRAGNAGLTGAGPLAELGVLREFVGASRPRDVYWLFYEGNDLIDLVSERQTILSRYLDTHFSQQLRARLPIVEQVEKRYADSLIQRYEPPSTGARARGFLTLRNLRTATGLYRGVKQPGLRDESRELALLKEVLASADSDVKSGGGTLHLVYLPALACGRRRESPAGRCRKGSPLDCARPEHRCAQCCDSLRARGRSIVTVERAALSLQRQRLLDSGRIDCRRSSIAVEHQDEIENR